MTFQFDADSRQTLRIDGRGLRTSYASDAASPLIGQAYIEELTDVSGSGEPVDDEYLGRGEPADAGGVAFRDRGFFRLQRGRLARAEDKRMSYRLQPCHLPFKSRRRKRWNSSPFSR